MQRLTPSCVCVSYTRDESNRLSPNPRGCSYRLCWQRFITLGADSSTAARKIVSILSLFKCLRFLRLGRLMLSFELLSGMLWLLFVYDYMMTIAISGSLFTVCHTEMCGALCHSAAQRGVLTATLMFPSPRHGRFGTLHLNEVTPSS